MVDFTREEVIAEARKILQRKPWYRGVCINKAHGAIGKANFDRAVQEVVDDTAYWDADKGPVNG